MSVLIVGLSNGARNVVHQTHDAKCPCIQRQSYHPIRTLVIFQTLRKPSGDMRARLEEAEERRKAQSEAKLKVIGSLKLCNVWAFVHLIHRSRKTTNQLYKIQNIA